VIHRDDVRKVAHLARVKLSDDELDKITHDLERIVGYVDELFAMDVGDVEPMTHAVPVECPRRPDESRDVLGPSSLTMSQGFEDNLVRVPKVVD
jgi:aspartyl-tRNA(Asn)/glutamyl-tRNA(Gln) amidotransferase subunit C